MKVKELVQLVETRQAAARCEAAEKVLTRKMRELERARSVVKALETELEKLQEMDIEDFDEGEYRY